MESNIPMIPIAIDTQTSMPTTLSQILKEAILFVVVNKSVSSSSTSFQVQDCSLNAWHLDEARARKVRYIISVLYGKGIGCYPVMGVGTRHEDGRVFFTNRDDTGNYIDLSYLVKGYDFKSNGYKTNYKEVQYLNC